MISMSWARAGRSASAAATATAVSTCFGQDEDQAEEEYRANPARLEGLGAHRLSPCERLNRAWRTSRH